jgi:hypothetical protein
VNFRPHVYRIVLQGNRANLTLIILVRINLRFSSPLYECSNLLTILDAAENVLYLLGLWSLRAQGATGEPIDTF